MANRNPRNLFNHVNRDNAPPILHLRFEGRSRDIALEILDVGVASSDQVVRDAVANFLDVNPAKLRGYVVERHPSGNLTLRPEAVFG